MGISRLTTLSAVKLDPDVLAGTSVTLGGIRRQMVRSGIDVRQESTSGAIYSQWQSVYAGAPMAEFGTVSLKRALDVVGTTGVAIAATSFTGVTFYGNSKSEGGGRQSGANHVSYNIKEGMLIPRRINVSHQGDAELSLEALATFDGTNAPVIQSNSASLLTGIADDQRYSIGGVQLGTINGDKITVAQISNLEIDFGINASAEGSDSDIYPTFACINDIPRPTIRITTSDPRLLVLANGIPLHGKDLNSSYTKIVLRKRKRISTSGYEADASLVHISITPLIGCAYLSDIGNYDGSGGNGSVVIEIPMISDGTSAPWSWSTVAVNEFP
jgi:hypothetical protein